MSETTRKRIWPVSLAATLGVVAMLAMMAATIWVPGTAQAQTTDAFPPNAPATLTTSGVTDTTVTLTWTAPTRFTSFPFRYMLERKEGSGNWEAVSPGPTGLALTYQDTGLTAETEYTYRVAGVNGTAGPGGWRESAAVTTLAAGSTPTPITPMPSGPIVMIPSDDGCGVVFNGDYDLAANGTIEVKCQVADIPDQVDILRVQFQKSTRIDPELQAVGDIVFTDYRSDDTQVVNEPEFTRVRLDAFDDADESANAAGTQISVPDDPATELRRAECGNHQRRHQKRCPVSFRYGHPDRR